MMPRTSLSAHAERSVELAVESFHLSNCYHFPKCADRHDLHNCYFGTPQSNRLLCSISKETLRQAVQPVSNLIERNFTSRRILCRITPGVFSQHRNIGRIRLAVQLPSGSTRMALTLQSIGSCQLWLRRVKLDGSLGCRKLTDWGAHHFSPARSTATMGLIHRTNKRRRIGQLDADPSLSNGLRD